MNPKNSKSSKPTVSVIVPVYNSSESLNILNERLVRILCDVAQFYEIIYIDDGSKDKSWQTIEGISKLYDEVRGVRHSRNYGQHNALLCGIREAQYDIIVTIDDDLQNPPEEIPKLIEKIQEGYDVVYGTPYKVRRDTIRNTSSFIIRFILQKSMGINTARYMNTFRAFRTVLRQSFADYNSPYVIIDVLLSWATESITHVKVNHTLRKFGKSNYTLSKLLKHAVNMIAGYSVLPLQLASYIGFIFTLFGLLVLSYVLIRYFIESNSVPGFPFLASVIAIFSGVQLFVLGIIGEYIARIYTRNMGRPYSVIKERVGYEVRYGEKEISNE